MTLYYEVKDKHGEKGYLPAKEFQKARMRYQKGKAGTWKPPKGSRLA